MVFWQKVVKMLPILVAGCAVFLAYSRLGRCALGFAFAPVFLFWAERLTITQNALFSDANGLCSSQISRLFFFVLVLPVWGMLLLGGLAS